MPNLIRPELKHLRQIVVLAKECVLATTNSESAEHDLHEFFKSTLVNVTTFFQIIEDEGEVKGFAVATLQKQIWSSEVLCNVGFMFAVEECDDELDDLFDNIQEWAKENKANKVMFVDLDMKPNIGKDMPEDFKQIGSIYGVEL